MRIQDELAFKQEGAAMGRPRMTQHTAVVSDLYSINFRMFWMRSTIEGNHLIPRSLLQIERDIHELTLAAFIEKSSEGTEQFRKPCKFPICREN
jgi:hypothetical protein